MKHVGDITKLNGAELPKVDCIAVTKKHFPEEAEK